MASKGSLLDHNVSTNLQLRMFWFCPRHYFRTLLVTSFHGLEKYHVEAISASPKFVDCFFLCKLSSEICRFVPANAKIDQDIRKLEIHQHQNGLT